MVNDVSAFKIHIPTHVLHDAILAGIFNEDPSYLQRYNLLL